MFETFDSTPTTYIPNNSFSPPPEIEFEVKINNLHELCCCGEMIGYYWEYGENIKIPITNKIPIEITDDDLISYVSGDAPDSNTEAVIGARCYNLIDAKSWQLMGKTEEGFIWQQDEHLTFFAPNAVKLFIIPDMTGKKLKASFYNHWGEEIYSQEFDEQNDGEVIISIEDSKEKFLRGVYNMYVSVTSDTLTEQINKYEVHVQ